MAPEKLTIETTEDVKPEDLKPCSFCGGTDPLYAEDHGFAFLLCLKCGARGPRFMPAYGDLMTTRGGMVSFTRALVRNAWNNRKGIDASEKKD